MAAHGADEVMNFAPQVTRYRGGNDTAVLKSIRRNYNPENKKSVYDMVISNPDDGRLVTKFAREGKTGRKEFEKVLKNRPESQVAGTGRGLGQAGQTPIPNAARDNNIPYRSVVVNPELPHISSLYEGLTPFQSGQLDRALKTGLSKTNMKAGSLESLNKVKQELGEMISKAKATDRPSEVRQLQELKNRFDTR